MRYVGRTALFCALIGFSLALIGCGKDPRDGMPTPSGTFAAVTNGYSPVVLVVMPDQEGICTGTVVSEIAVLSAAHCAMKNGKKIKGKYLILTDHGSFQAHSDSVYYPEGTKGDVTSTDDIAIITFNKNNPIAERGKDQIYGIGNSISERQAVRLVGYGCSNVLTRKGAGLKRTGTNLVWKLNDYIEIVSPLTSGRGVGGPENVAYSCFGDSGGPLLAMIGDAYMVVGVVHAGGQLGDYDEISQFTNVANNAENRNWLITMNNQLDLGIEIL